MRSGVLPIILCPKRIQNERTADIDHSNVFWNGDDRPVVTFSPYHEIDETVEVPGYDLEISDYSIYSYGTKTMVIRKNMLYGGGGKSR